MLPELRVDWSKGTAGFDGYALVSDTWYRVGGKWGWDEMVVSGAAAANTGDDVRLLVNHDGVPLARTWSGTLRLSSDRRGLRARAPALDLRNPTVAELVSASERGDLAEMSFAFRIDRQEWDGDYVQRRILSFEEIVDVAAVTYPASPTTSFSVGDARSVGVLDGFDDEAVEIGRASAAASAARLKYVRERDPKMTTIEARLRRVGL